MGALLSKPINHAVEFLNYLKEEKIPTALFTRNSKKVTEKKLEMHNLKFDICLTREDVKAKPDPAGGICVWVSAFLDCYLLF